MQDAADDIKRLRNDSKYKLVRSWDVGCHSILSMSCLNAMLSPLVLIAGSDKSVQMFDVAAGAQPMIVRYCRHVSCIVGFTPLSTRTQRCPRLFAPLRVLDSPLDPC